MRLKKVIFSTCLTAMLVTVGITSSFAYAGTTRVHTRSCGTAHVWFQNKSDRSKTLRADEQSKKAEFEAMKTKWTALDAASKSGIYDLVDNSAKIQSQIIDKLVELSVFDQTKADRLKTKITQHATQLREDGYLPMIGIGFKADKLRNGVIPRTDSRTNSSTISTVWSSLTSDQKEQVYSLMDQYVSVQSQIVGNLATLGVIDQTTATTLQANLTTAATQIRTNGTLPGLFFNMGFGKHGNCRHEISH